MAQAIINETIKHIKTLQALKANALNDAIEEDKVKRVIPYQQKLDEETEAKMQVLRDEYSREIEKLRSENAKAKSDYAEQRKLAITSIVNTEFDSCIAIEKEQLKKLGYTEEV